MERNILHRAKRPKYKFSPTVLCRAYAGPGLNSILEPGGVRNDSFTGDKV